MRSRFKEMIPTPEQLLADANVFLVIAEEKMNENADLLGTAKDSDVKVVFIERLNGLRCLLEKYTEKVAANPPHSNALNLQRACYELYNLAHSDLSATTTMVALQEAEE